MNAAAPTPVAKAAPQPLPRFDGGGHFQAALDADWRYRALVAAALMIAAAAGAGLGTLSSRAGLATALLWSVTVAGLVARCAARRDGLAGQLGRPGALVVLAAAPVVAAMASAADGLEALRTIGAAAAVGAALWLLSWRFPLSHWLSAGAVLAAGAASGAWAAPAIGGVNGWIAAGLGLAAAAIIVAASYRRAGGVDATVATTRLAGLGWAIFAWGGAARGGFHADAALVAALAVVALDLWTTRRRAFAAVVAAGVFIQLGALPPVEELLRGSLLLQPLFSIAAFAVLIIAGWRFVAASQARQPSVTYRIAPLCVVPRLDRGLDHPVKISVA